MKVILLQDVAKVGRKYEVKTVADGFGRNFLLSRNLAMVADARNLARLEEMKLAAAAEIALTQEEFKKALGKFEKKPVKIKAKANESGHLFASIHASEIATAAGLPADYIVLDHPLKQTGEHTINLKHGELKGDFKLIVEAAE